MNKKTRICAYCGNEGAITSDHIPPKVLFQTPRPSNLITVPACPSCNSSFAKDDEYFCIAMSLRPDVHNGPHGAYLWQKTLSSLQKPEAPGLRTSVLRKLVDIQFVDEDGRKVERGVGIDLDYPRLKATARRIVRGLYYHYFQRHIPRDYDVAVYYEELQRDHSFLHQPIFLEIMQMLSNTPLYERGDGVMTLRYLPTTEDSYATVWVIRILDSAGFFAFTTPLNRVTH